MSTISHHNIIVDGFPFTTIKEISIQHGPNEHAKAYVVGEISKQDGDDCVKRTDETTGVLIHTTADNQNKKLFFGSVSNLVMDSGAEYCTLRLELVSISSRLDIEKKNKTFQNTGKTYEEILNEAISGMGHVDFAIPDQPIGAMVVQYNETDWEFIKRMASRFNAPVLINIVSEKPLITVGLPAGGKTYELDAVSYHYGVDGTAYQSASQNMSDSVMPEDFAGTNAESYTYGYVGDIVNFNGNQIRIKSVRSELKDGLLVNHYFLAGSGGGSQKQAAKGGSVGSKTTASAPKSELKKASPAAKKPSSKSMNKIVSPVNKGLSFVRSDNKAVKSNAAKQVATSKLSMSTAKVKAGKAIEKSQMLGRSLLPSKQKTVEMKQAKPTVQKASAQKATLQKATMQKVSMQKAALPKETMQKVSMQKATLQQASMPKALMQKPDNMGREALRTAGAMQTVDNKVSRGTIQEVKSLSKSEAVGKLRASQSIDRKELAPKAVQEGFKKAENKGAILTKKSAVLAPKGTLTPKTPQKMTLSAISKTEAKAKMQVSRNPVTGFARLSKDDGKKLMGAKSSAASGKFKGTEMAVQGRKAASSPMGAGGAKASKSGAGGAAKAAASAAGAAGAGKSGGFIQSEQKNQQASGRMFTGVVQAVELDKVQVFISEIDQEYDGGGTQWLPYSTAYSSSDGSGWYCMPEIGDTVRVFFPSDNEADAFAASSVNVAPLDDPRHKSWRAPGGKEILLTDEGMFIICDKEKIFINLTDEDGISIYSEKDINIVSEGNVSIASKDTVELHAKNQIFMGTNGSYIDMREKEINLVSHQVQIS